MNSNEQVPFDRHPTPPIDYVAGRRFLIGFGAGIIVSVLFIAYKLNGFWESEYWLYWMAISLVLPAAWLCMHIDRHLFKRSGLNLSRTLLVFGLLCWLPVFFLLYVLRLVFK